MSRFRSRVLLAAGVSSCLLTSVAIGGTTAATSTTEPDSGAVEILPPDESFAGATLGEWGARWWQWTMSLPEAIHPGTDTTGERCGYGQQGPLFFLPIELGPGPSYTYECVVPEGTAIYVYMSAGFCSTVDPEPSFGRDVEELQACVDNFPDALGDLVTEVNGQEVANVDSFGATSPPFTLNIPADNIFAEVLPPGVALAVASTYAFIIAPPRPGAYVIRERWTTRENTAKTYTVYVTVEAPQIIEPTGTEPPQTTDAPDATEAP